VAIELAKANRHLNGFRPDIEGMRAIAVCLVVLFHAGVPFLQGGFVGVDIFFVVSGYLITSLLTAELNSSGDIRLSRFYARRARRLLPALSLIVIVVCLIQLIVASPIVQIEVLKAALATTLYCSNLYFAHTEWNYFTRALAPSPLLHTWSLAVEEQFYLIWPILILLITKATKSDRTKVAVIAGITLVSFVACVRLTAVHQVLSFYQLSCRAWEFSIGGLLSFVSVRWSAAHEKICKWLGAAGLITLVLSGVFIANSATFPGYIAAIPVLATVATLQGGAGAPSSPVARSLSWRPLQYLGGISYSLYLWHWPVLIIAQQLFPNGSATVPVACVALSVVLAAITHVAVENPIRFNPFLASKSLFSLGIVALSTTVCVGGFALWSVELNHSAQFLKFNRVRNDVPAFYAMGCTAAQSDDFLKLCSFGETAHPESTVVLFGDSHAAQWFPAMKDIAESRHWKLVTIIKSGCSPINIKILRGTAAETCERWRQRAIAKIQEMRPDTVVMASSSLYRQDDSVRLVDISEWEKGSRDTFLAISGHGIALRFIRDTPNADYDVPQCLAQLAWNGHAICPPLNRAKALNSEVFQAQLRAAAGIANIGIIDMSDTICGKDSCETEQGDIVKYRDGDHMTSSYVESLSNALQAQLVKPLD